MKKGNSLSFRAQSWDLIDEPHTGLTAAFQHADQVVHGKADMMDSRAAFRDVFPNRRVIRVPLEKFNQRFATGDSGNAGTIGVVQGYLWHQQHITQEWQQIVDGTNRKSDVGDARTAARWFSLVNFRHVDFSVCWGTDFSSSRAARPVNPV